MSEPVNELIDSCKCKDLLEKLDPAVQKLSTEISLSGDKLNKLIEDINSLNESIAILVPGAAAARQAVKLSTEAVRETAEALCDKELRKGRIIIWGRYSGKQQPADTALEILGHIAPEADITHIHASWLRAKNTKHILGLLIELPKCLLPAEILEQKSRIMKHFKNVTGLSRDRSLKERSLAKSKLSKLSVCDPKLKLVPKIILNDIRTTPLEGSTSSPTLSTNLPIMPRVKSSSVGLLGPPPTNRSQKPHFRLGITCGRPPGKQKWYSKLHNREALNATRRIQETI
ncbi:MAG: hypothetical protein ABW094_08330 [Candidatus Thiodiazotropha sp.]